MILEKKNSSNERLFVFSGNDDEFQNMPYGTWFNKLFKVMKSTANCQPEQTMEPELYPINL